MEEWRSNRTFQLALIGFILFVVIGTVLIFAFPDDESSTTEIPSGLPTISAANQTTVASLNATAAATTPTP